MLKYMKADLVRVMTRKPRIIFSIILMIGFAYLMKGDPKSETAIDMLSVMTTTMKILPPIIGLFEMMYIFGDDFKGKTAQIAIGIGISRKKIVLAKWFEMIIVSIIDLSILTLIYIVMTNIVGIHLPADIIGEMMISLAIAILTVTTYMAIQLPILFATQSITLSVLLYLLTSATLVARLIKALSALEFMQRWHIYSYTLDNCLNVFRTRLLLGNISITSLIGILIYMVIGLVAACLIYDHIELEF